MSNAGYSYAFVGGLREDYCITHDGQAHLVRIGGNAAYAAVGARLWNAEVGIISRVGINYPSDWLQKLEKAGICVEGVRVLPEAHDTRTFYAYLSPDERVDRNPAVHFQRVGLPLPKELMGYRTSTEGQDKRDELGPLAVRPTDIPAEMGEIKAAHFSPADYLTHSSVPFHLKGFGVSSITLDPSQRYMQPSFLPDLPGIIRGLDAFLPSEAEARSLFPLTSMEPWEFAEVFSTMGCDFVIIKCGARGQFVWDGLSKRHYLVPAYPAKVKDVTGAGDAFCGGFLVGFHATGDVVEASLRGSVSASFAVEGSDALYPLEVLTGLPEARLESLRALVKRL